MEGQGGSSYYTPKKSDSNYFYALETWTMKN